MSTGRPACLIVDLDDVDGIAPGVGSAPATRPINGSLRITPPKADDTLPVGDVKVTVDYTEPALVAASQGLIQEVGRSSTLGRPVLYGTTDEFLQRFGLGSLADLPGEPGLSSPSPDNEPHSPEDAKR